MVKNSFIFCIVAVATYSCIPPQIPLNKQEKKLIQDISDQLGCEVIFKHNAPCIESNSQNCGLGVFMCDELCTLENDSLIVLCRQLANKISKTVAYKNNYKSIHFGFEQTKNLNERSSIEICVKSLRFSMSKPDSLIEFIIKPLDDTR